MHFLAFFALLAAPTALVDRVGDTGFIQVEAESFHKLSPREQALAYWLGQASIATDPIIYDQSSRFGLRQKRLLEALVAHPQGTPPAVQAKILAFTKLFWANRGNHNTTTSRKFLSECTFQEFRAAAAQAGAGLAKEADALRASLFDPNFEPMMTAKSPEGGKDILQASSNNFYLGVAMADTKGFTEKYALNSRLVKRDGKLLEEVYRAGTPDGKVKPGLYARYLKKSNEFLAKARAYASPAQAAVIDKLIVFNQTGESSDWLGFGAAWVRNNEPVDFANGFIEVYMDARGAKGTSQSFVSVTDQAMNEKMGALSKNAQYFEDRAPWLAQYKKQGVHPPEAKMVEMLVQTGDFHVSTVGDNLPNEREVREKEGSKSFMISSNSRAIARALGSAAVREFAFTPEEIEIDAKFGEQAGGMMTALHEVIGHGSGKLSPKLKNDYSFYLKEYASTLEEARADLMALWSVWDPKVKQMGLVSDQEGVAKAMYLSAARAPLYQLRTTLHGETLEEDHQRDRALIGNYLMKKTGAVQLIERNGKSYMTVKDFAAMRKGVGELLAELMRIKAEGDYEAIKALVNQYGVRFDPKLRDQVVARYRTLNLPMYWAGVNADLKATLDASGKVTKVEMTYPRDFVKQQFGYSRMYE